VKVLETLENDPFQGAKERRVMPEGMKASDMELRAATDAIARAGIDAREIQLLLCHAAVPDYLVTNNGCLLHHQLELSRECLTMATDAACNSFVSQLGLAEQMIRGGRTKYALLVQSCGISRLLDRADPVSPNFGDGATAVVVGPVAAGRGVLSTRYRTDGSLHRGIVGSVRGRSWYDDGRVCMYSEDTAAARRTFFEIADRGKEVVESALADAAVSPHDVDFFGVHQGTSWSRLLLSDYFGLERARSVETFAWAASIFAGNIPLALSIAEKEGILRDDQTVAMFAGGAGLTYSAAVLRWGR
jgi:3-oxoacyl-[acyl-carrier-protein] synthase III